MPEHLITGLREEPGEEILPIIAKGKWCCRCSVCSEQRVSASGFMAVSHLVIVNFSRIYVI